MTYPEAIEFLYSLRWFGAKLGLSNTRRLAALLGDPQRQLRFIHVAGTNGKGSTCAMLESIYRAAGLRVGLFTSPHLVSFGERIQVNRQPINESLVVEFVKAVKPLLSQFAPADHPTFFEVVTVMALRHFAAQECELVIWETGLGGRLDATNIVTPLASVITNIHYDHQKWLGETLPSIAAEKAGIIKPRVPVLTATEASEALRVIQETARAHQAPLTIVPPSACEQPPLNTLELPLLGEHQKINAALALATVHALSARIPVTGNIIREGLSHVHWPGRLQLVVTPSGQRMLLDGAHNLDGAKILAKAWQQYFSGSEGTFILGIMQDKDLAGMCEILAPLAGRLLLVPVQSQRSASPQELAALCRRANPTARVQELSSLAAALQAIEREEFTVIAGSLYLVGEAMELLNLSPKAHLERELNEWRAV